MKVFSGIRGRSFSLNVINSRLKAAFDKIGEEMEDHLLAINENTNEIAANYEYICELENKIEKLTERVEQLQMYISGTIETRRTKERQIPKLTESEQNIFTVLYTLEEEKGSVTYEDIATQLDIEENEVVLAVSSMVGKGVLIVKRFIDSKPYLHIDKDFKVLQTKENVLQIEH